MNVNVALIESSSTNSGLTDKAAAYPGPNNSTSDDENCSVVFTNSRTIIKP